MSIKPKTFQAKLADIINLVDAIFDGNQEMPGWVFMAANAKGRNASTHFFRKSILRGAPLTQRYRETGEASQSTCRMLSRIRKQSCRSPKVLISMKARLRRLVSCSPWV